MDASSWLYTCMHLAFSDSLVYIALLASKHTIQGINMFTTQHFGDLICLVSITYIHVLLCRILRHCINSVLIVISLYTVCPLLQKMNEIAFNKTIIYYSILCLLDVGLVIANYVVQALVGIYHPISQHCEAHAMIFNFPRSTQEKPTYFKMKTSTSHKFTFQGFFKDCNYSIPKDWSIPNFGRKLAVDSGLPCSQP